MARRLADLPEGTRLLVGFDMPVVDARRPMPPAARPEDEEATVAEGERGRRRTAAESAGSGRSDRRETIAACGARVRPAARRRPDRLPRGRGPAALADRAALQVIVDRIKIDGEFARAAGRFD